MCDNAKLRNERLTDVQGLEDSRNVPIDKVGVKNIIYPICLRTRDGGIVHTVATVNMYVSLPHHQKGTHMSRFIEILNDHASEITPIVPHAFQNICHDIREKLNAQDAHLEIKLTYFINKKAPVTRLAGLINYEVMFEVSSNGEDDFIMGVKIPATSLCPCSLEISDYGAHNQRCEVEARVRYTGMLWIEDLVEIMEKAPSSQVYAALKRADEKFVTEHAYDNPKFVEDIVRDLAMHFDNEERITWYAINSENFESIHNHNAYAYIEKDKRI